MINLSEVGQMVVATIATFGLVGAGGAWLYKRGGVENRITDSVDRNTRATDKLTDKLDGVVDTLHDHAIRLTRLEIRDEAPPNGSSPTHRDAGSGVRHQEGRRD